MLSKKNIWRKYLKSSGKTPEKCYSLVNKEIKHTFACSVASKGRKKVSVLFPELQSVLEGHVEHKGLGATEKRDAEYVLSGVSLKDLQQHTYKSVGGLAKHKISLNTIARHFVAPNKQRKTSGLYKEVIKAKRAKKRNKHRKQDADAHFYCTRGKHIRQFCAKHKQFALEVSADNKNKLNVGTPAVSRYIQPAGYTMENQDTEGLRDHDFPIPGYKLVPMGYMFLEPIQGDHSQTVEIDKLGRTQFKVPTTGEMTVIIRASKYFESTIEPHVNDLLVLAPPRLNGRTILSINVDNGPDYSSNSTLNQLYFCRLFKDLGLDIMFVWSHAPNWSAYNSIERGWGPLTLSLAGLVCSKCVPNETVEPVRQTGLSDSELKIKEAIVFDNACKEVIRDWSKVKVGGHPVFATYQPVNSVNAPYNDHNSVKSTIKKVTAIKHNPDLEAELQFMIKHMIKRRDMLQFKKCLNTSCFHCSNSPIVAKEAHSSRRRRRQILSFTSMECGVQILNLREDFGTHRLHVCDMRRQISNFIIQVPIKSVVSSTRCLHLLSNLSQFT